MWLTTPGIYAEFLALVKQVTTLVLNIYHLSALRTFFFLYGLATADGFKKADPRSFRRVSTALTILTSKTVQSKLTRCKRYYFYQNFRLHLSVFPPSRCVKEVASKYLAFLISWTHLPPSRHIFVLVFFQDFHDNHRPCYLMSSLLKPFRLNKKY